MLHGDVRGIVWHVTSNRPASFHDDRMVRRRGAPASAGAAALVCCKNEVYLAAWNGSRCLDHQNTQASSVEKPIAIYFCGAWSLGFCEKPLGSGKPSVDSPNRTTRLSGEMSADFTLIIAFRIASATSLRTSAVRHSLGIQVTWTNGMARGEVTLANGMARASVRTNGGMVRSSERNHFASCVCAESGGRTDAQKCIIVTYTDAPHNIDINKHHAPALRPARRRLMCSIANLLNIACFLFIVFLEPIH